MSEERYGVVAQLKEVCNFFPIASVSKRLGCVAIMICMANTPAIASADATDSRTSGKKHPHSKAAHKKTDSYQCGAQDAKEYTSELKLKPFYHDQSCLVPVSDIDKLGTQKNFNIVDVRSPIEYDRYRIVGSINIPLHLVKTKEFLKKQSIVLVNDGRSTTELEKTCGELKRAGFERVGVLEGGLFAWFASKRTLEGDMAAQSNLNRMSPGELFEVRNASDWSVIDATTSGRSKDMRTWLPAKLLAAPVKSGAASIASIPSFISKQRSRNPQGKLLLIADDNATYDRIDALLKKSGLVASSILRLDGGIKGYREHVARQQTLWNQQNQPRRYEACRG
jgi:rhodanese-related sulfurtransferase